MAQDAKFVNKLDILSLIWHFKSYFSYVLKMRPMGTFIRHKCDKLINTVGHHCLKALKIFLIREISKKVIKNNNKAKCKLYMVLSINGNWPLQMASLNSIKKLLKNIIDNCTYYNLILLHSIELIGYPI